jgi:hypothetical protein
MLLATTVLTLIGWFLNPLIRLMLPNLALTTVQSLWFSNAASLISNLGMFATPIVIYIFRFLQHIKKKQRKFFH